MVTSLYELPVLLRKDTQMSIIKEIEAHEKKSLLVSAPAEDLLCPKCDKYHQSFKLYERRPRLFLVVVKDLVEKIWSFLLRWKCCSCGRTITEYPAFAVPHKRYTVHDILHFSKRYVETPSMTYQKVVQDDKLPIAYADKNGEIEGKEMAGSSVWRWLSFLGSAKNTIRDALHIIRRKDPNCEIFRKYFSVDSQKYKSKEREMILKESLKLFNIKQKFDCLFETNNFLHYAIRHRFS